MVNVVDLCKTLGYFLSCYSTKILHSKLRVYRAYYIDIIRIRRSNDAMSARCAVSESRCLHECLPEPPQSIKDSHTRIIYGDGVVGVVEHSILRPLSAKMVSQKLKLGLNILNLGVDNTGS